MSYIPAWQEIESKVYRPGLRLALLAGAFFALVGSVGFFLNLMPGGAIPSWLMGVFAGIFVLFGGVILAWALRGICSPTIVRHAAPDVLPNVPREPVICEGSIVHGRLAHELGENDQGWEFRLAGSVWRNDKRFLLGFGIFFPMLFSGIVSWVLHSQLNIASWPVSAVCAAIVGAVCGGSTFLLIYMIMRSGYRRLSKLTIPRTGNDLEFEFAEGLEWAFSGEAKRQRLTIPRGQVAAVQLCPWKYLFAQDSGWAVQGILVLASPDRGEYRRLPLLLTSDFVGAGRLMQRLAGTLQVPYLFCADAVGWKTEEIRAKNRPPLRGGGTQT